MHVSFKYADTQCALGWDCVTGALLGEISESWMWESNLQMTVGGW